MMMNEVISHDIIMSYRGDWGQDHLWLVVYSMPQSAMMTSSMGRSCAPERGREWVLIRCVSWRELIGWVLIRCVLTGYVFIGCLSIERESRGWYNKYMHALPVGVSSITLNTSSNPSVTCPNTTCLPSKWGVLLLVMKNWLPLVPDQHGEMKRVC